MRKIISLIIFLLCLLGTHSYDQRDVFEQIMAYLEENSYLPILHVYYNQHFKNSKDFEEFLEIIQEVEYRNKDYVRFLFTDCELIQQGKSPACETMRKTKDNHFIVGSIPSSNFINYAGKKIQSPPSSKPFRRIGSTYKVEEIQAFITQIMPLFYENINSLEQFQTWLEPKYTPNLIFASNEDEVPLVITQIGVHYFLRFDLGYLSDLTEEVVKQLNITTFPSLLVLKYSFKENKYQLHKYQGKSFTPRNYDEIKAFLEPLALKQQRNDLIFHKIRPPKDEGIRTTDSEYELLEMLDRSSGWVFIQQYKSRPLKLQKLKQRYGQFFEYIHYINATQQTQTINLYDPEKKKTLTLAKDDLQFVTLSKTDFLSNTSALLSKNFVVMGVRQKYSHYCALAVSTLFRGVTYCFILKESDYEQTQKALNNKFEYGFVGYEITKNGKKSVSGNNFGTDSYEHVYYTTEYQMRMKSQQIVDSFHQKPIRKIEGTQKISQICSAPLKKCVLLFTRSTKQDRTAYDYLSEIATNLINEYLFFEIDLECNPHFEQEIESLQNLNSGLVVYHPRQQSYVYLKAKLSKSTFQRFLRINLQDNKKLPFKKWKTQGVTAKSCQKEKAVPIDLVTEPIKDSQAQL